MTRCFEQYASNKGSIFRQRSLSAISALVVFCALFTACSGTSRLGDGSHTLTNKSVYVVYTSTEGFPDSNWNGSAVVQIENESIYLRPLNSKQEENRVWSGGFRISEPGMRNSPIWNKAGTRVAYLKYYVPDPSVRLMRGSVVIRDTETGAEQEFDTHTSRSPNNLTWSTSGSRLFYNGKGRSIYSLDFNSGEIDLILEGPENTLTLNGLPSGPAHYEYVTVSPDEDYLCFMTRDIEDMNDADGWRLNIYQLYDQQLVKVGVLNDDFGLNGPFYWKYDSSQILFTGFFIKADTSREYGWWIYDLSTQRLDPFIGNVRDFYQPKVRYWTADQIMR